MRVSIEHLEERVRQRGAEYADALAPAIISRDLGFIEVDTSHPAFVALAEKYAPTPEDRAKREAAMQRRMEVLGPKIWDILHGCICPTPALIDHVTNLIPCGECKTHFVELLKELPPIYGSLAAYRYRSWEWHDRIDKKLGKFRPTFEEVARARRWT